ncbi:MAG TPA: YdeI/OmpD-associated family protein [Anaerolineae bacterium]|nr:YdeI/OmpD-associated family protein [Anaerolineae bacterium]
MKLRAKILGAGKTAAGIEIPAKVVASLGSSKRPPVRVTINGYTYRSSIASLGGKFMLGVSNEIRDKTGVAVGDTVDVDIELDTAPRQVTVPPDLQKALDRDAQAKKFFESLSYSNKKWFVLAVEGAKTAETRQRRIANTVKSLHDGKI